MKKKVPIQQHVIGRRSIFLPLLLAVALCLPVSLWAQTRDSLKSVKKLQPALFSKTTVDLGFTQKGVVSKVYVRTGSRVEKGQPLVELDKGELVAQLHILEANVEIQRAQLTGLKKGVDPGALKSSEIKLDNAKTALADVKRDTIDTLLDAYTRSDDAVRGKTDQFFSNSKGSIPQLIFQSNDVSLQEAVSNKRASVESVLNVWKTSLEALSASDDLLPSLKDARRNLLVVKNFLDLVAYTLSSATPNLDLSSVTLRNWKSDVSTGRTNVNVAIKNLTGTEDKLHTAAGNIAFQEQELNAKKIPAGNDQIALQESRIKEAEARAELLRVQVDQLTLRSPVAGTVKKLTLLPGSLVTQSSSVVSIEINQKR